MVNGICDCVPVREKLAEYYPGLSPSFFKNILCSKCLDILGLRNVIRGGYNTLCWCTACNRKRTGDLHPFSSDVYQNLRMSAEQLVGELVKLRQEGESTGLHRVDAELAEKHALLQKKIKKYQDFYEEFEDHAQDKVNNAVFYIYDFHFSKWESNMSDFAHVMFDTYYLGEYDIEDDYEDPFSRLDDYSDDKIKHMVGEFSV